MLLFFRLILLRLCCALSALSARVQLLLFPSSSSLSPSHPLLCCVFVCLSSTATAAETATAGSADAVDADAATAVAVDAGGPPS